MNSSEWKELQTLTAEIDTNQERLSEARSRRAAGRVQRLEEEIARAEKRRADLLAYISAHLVNTPATAGRARANDTTRSGAKSQPASQTAPVPEEASPSAPTVEDVTAEETGVPAVFEPSATKLDAAEPIPPEDGEVREAAIEVPEELVAEEVAIAATPARQDQTAAKPASVDVKPTSVAAVETSAEAIEEIAIPSSEAAPPAKTNKRVTAEWDQLTTTDIERAKRELAMRLAKMLARHAEELKSLEADRTEIDTLAAAIDAFVGKFKVSSAEGMPSRRPA